MSADRWPPRVNLARLLLGCLVAATLLALVVAGSTSTGAFGAYNGAWDGAAELRSHADAAGVDHRVVRNATAYGDVPASASVAVVLSPDEPYGPAAARRVRSFVRAGGTLVVGEDYGPHGNALLAAVGARARVDGRPLRDDRHHYRSPALPEARAVAPSPLTAGVESLTLNHGTAVEPNGADVLVATSRFAYLDGNRNGAPDPAESVGTYPVATVERVGAGRVVVLGDPSALINVMVERPGNRAFVGNLLAGHERLLLDHSHDDRIPPIRRAVLLLRARPDLQVAVGTAALALVALATRWSGRVRGRADDRLEGHPADAGAGGPSSSPGRGATRVLATVRGILTGRDERGEDG